MYLSEAPINWCQTCGLKCHFACSVANNGRVCSIIIQMLELNMLLVFSFSGCRLALWFERHSSLRFTDLSELDYVYSLLYVWILDYVPPRFTEVSPNPDKSKMQIIMGLNLGIVEGCPPKPCDCPKTQDMLKCYGFWVAETREMLRVAPPKPYKCPQSQDMLKNVKFFVLPEPGKC